MQQPASRWSGNFPKLNQAAETDNARLSRHTNRQDTGTNDSIREHRNTLFWMKEGRHKRPHSEWIHLCERFTRGKFRDRKQVGSCPGLVVGMRNGSDCWIYGILFWEWWKYFGTWWRWWLVKIVTVLNATGVFTLRWWVFCNLTFTSIKNKALESNALGSQ